MEPVNLNLVKHEKRCYHLIRFPNHCHYQSAIFYDQLLSFNGF